MIPLLNDYPYLYETHLHTSQSSAGVQKTPARRWQEPLKAAGYTGIFVTDHHWERQPTAGRSLPWADWVHAFSAGCRDARKEGDRIGLDVFLRLGSQLQRNQIFLYTVLLRIG